VARLKFSRFCWHATADCEIRSTDAHPLPQTLPLHHVSSAIPARQVKPTECDASLNYGMLPPFAAIQRWFTTAISLCNCP